MNEYLFTAACVRSIDGHYVNQTNIDVSLDENLNVIIDTRVKVPFLVELEIRAMALGVLSHGRHPRRFLTTNAFDWKISYIKRP